MDPSPLASLCSSFRSAPGPGLLYLSHAHRQTLDGIVAGIGGDRPLQVLTGEAGIGKTTLAQQVAVRAAADRRVGQIGRTNAQLLDLRHQVPRAFGLPPPTGADDAAGGQQAVAAVCQDGDRPALLIVDEAQGLPDAGLDDLAALTDGPRPLSLLLVGAPGLESRLARHPVLGSRIGGRFRLAALDQTETAAYVAHRFRIAGCASHSQLQAFDDDGIARLFALSKGVPRIVNHLVQSCLFEAATTGRTAMDGAFVRAHLAELVAEGRLAHLLAPPPRPAPDRTPPPAPLPSVPPPAPQIRPATAPAQSAAPRRAHRVWAARAGLAAALAGMLVLVPGGLRITRPEGAISAAGVLPMPAQRPAPRPAPAPVPVLPSRVAIQPVPVPERLLAEALTVGSADPQRAVTLYTRAALWGSTRAAYYLGQIHETGDGVAPDLNRARAWYRAAGGIGGAALRLAALGNAVPAAPAPLAAPLPDRQALFADGRTELHWQSPDAAPRFRVEIVPFGGNGQIRRVETAVNALLVPQPVARWRVTALGPDGAAGPPSAWSRLAPGPR